MNISNKTRYGLRAVIYLGLKYNKESISIKEISMKENISKRYLEQIFAELKKGGIIKSIKGTKGGYFLTKDPSEISIGNVLRLLEGELSIVENSNVELKVENIEHTLQNTVWNRINYAIIDIVDSITIGNIIEKHNNTNMFYI